MEISCLKAKLGRPEARRWVRKLVIWNGRVGEREGPLDDVYGLASCLCLAENLESLQCGHHLAFRKVRLTFSYYSFPRSLDPGQLEGASTGPLERTLAQMPQLRVLSIPRLVGWTEWRLGVLTHLELTDVWGWRHSQTLLPEMPCLQSLTLVFFEGILGSSLPRSDMDLVDFDRYPTLSHLKIEGLERWRVVRGRAAALTTLELINSMITEPL